MNPYTIILALFIVSGIGAMLWGWRLIAAGKKSIDWPYVDGTIKESRQDDLLPHIEYSYTVAEQTYQANMTISGDITPSEEFTKSYLEKFPVGKTVKVYYNPDQPDSATLEPGPGKGDWIVFAIGLATTVLGILFLFFTP